ncbi:hypothetical protein KKA13_04285 [Patescibacteria group bacterium]|nr:hypothetical protein [Patescibacteria group bacterium]
MKSTLSIFKIFYNKLPPLVPGDILSQMKKALDDLENDESANVEKVENAMVRFGYEVWPWHKAHKEYLVKAEEQMGNHFLWPRLQKTLREKCKKYYDYGMTISDLRSGRPALEYFSSDERVALGAALVGARCDLDNYVDHQISSLEKEKYLQRVDELFCILEEVKQKLDFLRAMADKEYDHPNLADEIRSRVTAFEHGLCWLAPDLDHEAVHNAVDFFKGRRLDLGRMRGINTPCKIDI